MVIAEYVVQSVVADQQRTPNLHKFYCFTAIIAVKYAVFFTVIADFSDVPTQYLFIVFTKNSLNCLL